jgi:zinc protease
MESLKDTLKRLRIRRIAEAQGIVEYRLSNGLKVLLKPNHSAPVVSFMVVYRVGSRNEANGFTGSTHFLEHMMFKGTRRFSPEKGNGVMETFGRIGALLNATTWLDRTNYFECVSSDYLELCIEVEADRMRNLRLRQEDRDSEMTVVRNEFERGENDPASALDKELNAIAFREHPYHWPTIGWRTDVEGVPIERMKEFYDTYYWPNNATVIIVGDFDEQQALKLISRHFGKIPSSPHPIPGVYTHEPPQEGERRFVLKRAGDLPMLVVGYHTPEAAHPDTYALSAMRAVLGDAGKRSSRLYRALMDSGLCTSCYSQNGEFRDPSLFEVGATLTPDASFDKVEQVIYEEIERLAREPVSEDELRRAKSANRKGTVLANADPMSFINLLCQAEASADWKWAVEYDDKFDAVSPEDIMRVARTYFAEDNRTVGRFIPTEREPLHQPASASAPSAVAGNGKNGKGNKNGKGRKTAARSATTRKTAATKAQRFEIVRPSRTKRATFASQVVREVLPNGLTLLIMPNRGTGSVAIQGIISAGDYFTPDAQTSLAGVTANMMTKGSSRYSKVQLAEILEEMGTRLGFGTDRFKANCGTLLVAEDLPRFVPVLADVIRNPSFVEDELTQTRREFTAGLTKAMNNTAQRARQALMQTIYPPGHPFYETPYDSRIAELGVMNSDHLRQFHSATYTPANTILTIVGDIEADEVRKLFEESFGDWQGQAKMPIAVEAVGLPDRARRLEIPLPDKANCDIMIGHPTDLSRRSDDFFAAYIANAALGGDTISDRLGKELRVKHGLTYGVYSGFEDVSFGAAAWKIQLSVNPNNIEQALQLVEKVVADYHKKGISKAELEDKVGDAVGSFIVQLRSSSGIAQALSRFEFMGLGIEAMDRLPDDFYSVTKAQVDAAIRRYIHPDKLVTAIAGTFARVPAGVR